MPCPGVHGHNPARSKHQLILGMRVLGDDVSVLEIVRQRGDLGQRLATLIQ
jgi:hypothetical protein